MCRKCGRMCRKCGRILSRHLTGWYHINCEPGVKFLAAPNTGSDHPMRTELVNAFLTHDASRARSRQVEIGPSEIGTSCERLLGYKMAGIGEINRTNDPWPAYVGTAIHAQFQEALELYNRTVRPRFLTERKVYPDPIVQGTADAYDVEEAEVIDLKSMGKSKERELDEVGPPWGYYVQIQTYGLGYLLAGYQVKTVSLFFVPRAGYLKRSARYYRWTFDETVAREAIARLYRVGGNVLALRNAAGGEDFWSKVPADGGKNCGLCPFYRRPEGPDDVATADGCPGR